MKQNNLKIITINNDIGPSFGIAILRWRYEMEDGSCLQLNSLVGSQGKDASELTATDGLPCLYR